MRQHIVRSPCISTWADLPGTCAWYSGVPQAPPKSEAASQLAQHKLLIQRRISREGGDEQLPVLPTFYLRFA